MAEEPKLPLPSWALEAASKPGARARVESRLEGILAKLRDTKLIERVRELFGYVTDPRVPAKYKAIVLAGLIYLINPFDLIPDAIPGAGFLDDGAVVLAVLEAVRRIIGHAEESAKEVVTHAVAETEEAFARRGVQQIALSLWAVTLAACVGLVYAAATRVLAPDASRLADPFVLAMLVIGVVGLASSAALARRVWQRYQSTPTDLRARLEHAILATIGVREVVLLALPVVVLVLVLGIRLGLSLVR